MRTHVTLLLLQIATMFRMLSVGQTTVEDAMHGSLLGKSKSLANVVI